MSARKKEFCLRCQCGIETNESAVAMFLYAQTVGISKRQKAKGERLYFCAKCAVVLAMGAKPNNGALNVAAFNLIRGMVGKNPAVTEKAWQELNESLVPISTMPALTEGGEAGEILPPLLRAS